MAASTSDPQTSHAACAACRYQRKKCAPSCLLRRHFPASNTDAFSAVHRVFGVANVIKMMKEAQSTADQDKVAESLHWEARLWARDPVRGPLGAYAHLQEKNRHLMDQLNQFRMQLSQPPQQPHVNSNYIVSPQQQAQVNNSYMVPPQQQAQGNNNVTLPPLPPSLDVVKEEFDMAMVTLTSPDFPWSFTVQQDWPSPPPNWP